MRLHNKSIIVTGSGSGIGEGIALRLAAEGAQVIVNDIDVPMGERVVSRIVKAGGTASFFAADVTKSAEIKALVAAAVERYGKLDVVVNNAGWTHRNQSALDVSEDDFDKCYAINVKSIYLIGQDYSFGQSVLKEAKRQLTAQRPDVQIVGDELHPLGRVKDFIPYAAKIKASGAQAVLTGNWGNDLTLLIKAAKDVGFEGKFYTFYGNALGAPAAIGDAGVGKVIAVAEWFPNAAGMPSETFYQSFRQRFPAPKDDYVHMRMQMVIEALAQSIEKAGAIEAGAVAAQMEKVVVTMAGQTGAMRAADHQFQQPLLVAQMGKLGDAGVKFDVEGSGYGFRVIKAIASDKAAMATTCKMVRP